MNDSSVYAEARDTDIKVSPFVGMSVRELITTILVGAGAGLVATAITILMNKFVFAAVLCRPEAATDCTNAPMYSMIVGLVIGSIAGLVALAQLRVYRPLLIVVATVIALWGFQALVGGLAWYWALLVMMLLFGLSYGLFAWIARVRSFLLAAVIAVVLVVLVRLLLVA
jgi:hypothetical protein